MTVDPRAMMHVADAAVSLELETPGMTLNIGPQHPSTHGVLRLKARIDGERIVDVLPVLGYMHRGYEKLVEVRTYPQVIALLNRIDWVSGYANEIPFVVAAERLMEVEPPPRAQYIRLILTEMARIGSHFLFMASYPLELGAASPFFFAFRERERVLDLIESVTGGRFHPNFNRIGGVKPVAGAGVATKKIVQDLPKGFYAETREAMAKVLAVCDELYDLIVGNEILFGRTKGIGVMSVELAVAYGVSGPNLRASGVEFDLRRTEDYLPYDDFDFWVPTGEAGDCYDRYIMRLHEIRVSAKLILEAIEGIPEGPIIAKVPKVIKLPKGEIYMRAENPKGEMGYYLVSEGGTGPYRLKVRTASFSNISVLPELLEGVLVPDLIAIFGSFDFVLGDVDR
ncbi:NADH-quinone oxidoreductase subunit 4 [bacterium BMS3Abin02]|nr:NADH-quinone oxidoreductase subunit 4 [bacterium BMS3Abin02]GBE22269.1 NADH-quinone oxidoreductase subunit 4 [bacterium BMS3Bbin01]